MLPVMITASVRELQVACADCNRAKQMVDIAANGLWDSDIDKMPGSGLRTSTRISYTLQSPLPACLRNWRNIGFPNVWVHTMHYESEIGTAQVLRKSGSFQAVPRDGRPTWGYGTAKKIWEIQKSLTSTRSATCVLRVVNLKAIISHRRDGNEEKENTDCVLWAEKDCTQDRLTSLSTDSEENDLRNAKRDAQHPVAR